jgi:hypothetical protein
MDDSLPTAEQLEKLPLRAIVAYAARNARRLSSKLRGIVPDQVLDEVLQLMESVSTFNPIGEVDKRAVTRSAERITSAYVDAPEDLKSLKTFRIVFALSHAATTAAFALIAAADPVRANPERKVAAEEAQQTVRPIDVLQKKAADAARSAARRDYDILVREYGEHEEVVVGEPIHCFDSE